MAGKIIIVEDNPADAKVLKMALARQDPAITTVVLDDGALAIDYFVSLEDILEALPCDLILLDLNLPRVNGFEVLEFLKSRARLRQIPVVVLSGSKAQHEIERCYTLGANSYVCKPMGIDEVFELSAQLVTYWFRHSQSPRRGDGYGFAGARKLLRGDC